MTRTPITSIFGKKITAVRFNKGNPGSSFKFYEFIGTRGKVLFTVPLDNVFDADGNRFDTDAIWDN
jgi:hypothetical protein